MMTTTLRTSMLPLALAITATLPNSAAIAQQSEQSLQLEEVVVTARRRSENLQDVPIAVTAFSSEELALRGTSDISEIAQSVPSVTLEPSRATNSTLTAFMRGVGQQDPLAGFEQGVALYVDDVYLARPQGSLLEIYDIERIEVLRGPQGTLYGRNAVGGAIKYVTRRLANEPALHLKGSLGSYDQVDGVITGSVPFSDSVRAGAAVASLNRNGYGANFTTGDDQYNKEILAARASLEIEPSDALLIRIAADYSKDDSNPVAGYRPNAGAVSGIPVLDDVHDSLAGAADNPSTAGIDGNNEVETKGVSASIEWELNDSVILKSISAYREDYTESVIDFDSLPVDDVDAPVIYENDQFSQELQLLYSAERVKGVFGFYYLEASAANDFDVVLGQLPATPKITAYTGGTVDTKAWSLFADVSYDVTDKLSLSIGGRYTEDERSADIFRANYIGLGSPFFGNTAAIEIAVNSDYSNDRTFYDFSPRVNINYTVNDAVNLYAGYSQGFKAGSFDPRGANLIQPEVEQGFKPEQLDSFEVGVKSTWLDGRARTNIAAFYSEYKDMQVPGSLPVDTDNDGVGDDFIGTVTNAGESEIAGVEFEGEFLLTEGLSVQLSFSVLDTDIKEWILNGVNVADQREIQNTPERMAYLGLNYSMFAGPGSLNLNANLSHKDDIFQFEIPVPEIDQSAYDIVNASIVWASNSGTWSVGLHGKNLTDEEYKTSGYNFPTLGTENNVTVFYGAPQTFTFTVDYRI